jgi:hypothetical protein
MRDWGSMVVVALVVALLSSGCVTVNTIPGSFPAIRGTEPYRTLTSTKAQKELAKCIEFTMRAELEPALIVNLEEYPNNTYRVVITCTTDNRTAYGRGAVEDILIKPTDSGSIVECRKRSWADRVPEILRIVERCAK